MLVLRWSVSSEFGAVAISLFWFGCGASGDKLARNACVSRHFFLEIYDGLGFGSPHLVGIWIGLSGILIFLR
jgi:hypothetical protein